jgi:hypothetical protein
MQTLHLHPETILPKEVRMWDMCRHIYTREGLLAFYKGLGASFLGLTHVGRLAPGLGACLVSLKMHATAVQFPLYEKLKSISRDRNQGLERSIDLVLASAGVQTAFGRHSTCKRRFVSLEVSGICGDVSTRGCSGSYARQTFGWDSFSGIMGHIPSDTR